MQRKWRIWKPFLRRYLQRKAAAYDLCVTVVPENYAADLEGLYDFSCTEYVRQVIDVSGGWQGTRSAFSKTKRQITNRFEEKFGLEYRISTDINEFKLFYHKMFVPHIKKRFKDLSNIESYAEMMHFFIKGQLLLITRDSEIIAAALFLVEDDTLVFRRTGVINGDESLIKGGAQLALYYFQIQYAIDQNLKYVDTMLSSAFMNDGVYKNKREWGASVLEDESAENRIYFSNAKPSPKISQFFENNPLIIDSAGGLKGVVGVSDSAEMTSDSIERLIGKYRIKGVASFSLITPTEVIEHQ